MNRRIRWAAGVVVGAVVLLAALIGVAGMSQAAADGSLNIISADCFGFNLEARFRGTTDEAGYDYVRLRVIDADGNEIYRALPWRVRVGRTTRVALNTNYQHTPTAGPLLFVLDDFEQFGLRRLQSLASVLVDPACPSLPVQPPPAVTLTCTVRLRTGPGLNFRVREFVRENTTLQVIGRLYDASWLEVRTDDGMLGWVFDGLCVPGSPGEATYHAAPVTFFRNADEVLQYANETSPSE